MRGRPNRIAPLDAEIRRLAAEGKTLAEVAAAIGRPKPGVYAHCRREGITFARSTLATRDAIHSRNQRIEDIYRQGVTLEKIGAQFSLTRERVRQILAKRGVAGDDGGKRAQIAMAGGRAVDRKRTEKRRQQELLWGVSYDLLSALRSEGHTAAYRNHKNSAAARGIQFDLSLGQWWAIWQASGHAHERGRGKGKYCMSRMSDAGGYVLGNIHIQPCVENSRDAVKTWLGKPAKANPGVFLLYPGLKTPYMAKVGKKRLGLFATEADAVKARADYAEGHYVALDRLGSGRGWTYMSRCKSRPYFMQGPGGVRKYCATQQEAEAAYAEACEAHRRLKQSAAVPAEATA